MLVELTVIANLNRAEAAHAANAIQVDASRDRPVQLKLVGLQEAPLTGQVCIEVVIERAAAAARTEVKACPGGGRHVFRCIFQAAAIEVCRLGAGAHAQCCREHRGEHGLLHCVYSPNLAQKNATQRLHVFEERIAR